MIANLMRCYLCGLSFTLGVGPVFLLTFRAVMLFGFWYGVVVAAGAACADSILFFLGIKGLLTLLHESKFFLGVFDIFGAIALISLGIYSFMRTYEMPSESVAVEANIIGLFCKSFFLTLLSPFSIAVFAFIGMKLFPNTVYQASLVEVMLNSLSFGSGTFTGLVVLSALIRWVGSSLSKKYFNFLCKCTAVGFIIAGIYFVFDFIKTISL